MKLLAVLLLTCCVFLSSCEFALFSYRAKLVPTKVAFPLDESETTTEPRESVDLVGSVPVLTPYDLVLGILSKSEAIDAAQVLAICTVGDPAAISSWLAKTPVKVEVEKRFFWFSTGNNDGSD